MVDGGKQEENHKFDDLEWMSMPYRVHFFDYTTSNSNVRIWGLTAAILIRTASVVLGKSATFGEFHPAAPEYGTVLAELVKKRLLVV